MKKEIVYKLQGNGSDSWTVTEKDETGNVVNRYMVYDDPTIHTLIKLFKELTKEQRDQIKNILK